MLGIERNLANDNLGDYTTYYYLIINFIAHMFCVVPQSEYRGTSNEIHSCRKELKKGLHIKNTNGCKLIYKE